MQLILIFLLSILKTQDIKNTVDYMDPYDYSDLFDPTIPDKTPNDLSLLNTPQQETSNMQFIVFPRLVFATDYSIKGIELIFANEHLLNYSQLAIDTKYLNLENKLDYTLLNLYNLRLKADYKNLQEDESLLFSLGISIKKSFLSLLTLDTGIFLSQKTFHPLFSFSFGTKLSKLSYYVADSLLFANITSYGGKNNFYTLDLTYYKGFNLGDSIIHTQINYIYEAPNTPYMRKTKMADILHAYNTFDTVKTEKTVDLELGYSVILYPQLYASIVYQGAFFINTVDDINYNNLVSSYTLSFSYVSLSIKHLRYFIGYSIGRDNKHKFMLGIKS